MCKEYTTRSSHSGCSSLYVKLLASGRFHCFTASASVVLRKFLFRWAINSSLGSARQSIQTGLFWARKVTMKGAASETW